jgi:hypothetical protein
LSSLICVYPAVQVADIQKYAAVSTDHGQLATGNHVLHGLFRAAQIDGGLLDGE